MLLAQQFSMAKFSFGLNYNSFAIPINKKFYAEAEVRPIEILKFSLRNDYDLLAEQVTKREYGMTYLPGNNCWKVKFIYSRDIVETTLSVNFMVNYNQASFQE
jgi:hypothetical protein